MNDSSKSSPFHNELANTHKTATAKRNEPIRPPADNYPWGLAEPLSLVACYKHRYDTFLWATVYFDIKKNSYVTWTWNAEQAGFSGGGYDLSLDSAMAWFKRQLEAW